MALRVKNRPNPALDQLDEFWTEFRAVEESRVPQPTEDEHEDKDVPGEQEVEWLKEAGFNVIVKKYRDSKEIDPNDVDVQEITSSLTRTQAEAVKRRIDTLNDTTKRKLGIPVTPSLHTSKHNHADVRTIFPVQTSGQPSNSVLGSSTETALYTTDSTTTHSITTSTSTTRPIPISTNTKVTSGIVTGTSSTTSRIHLPSNIIRPTLPRRTVSEGVSLIKTTTGSDNVGNFGIAGKYSLLSESLNGEHYSPKDKSSPGRHHLDDRRTSEDVRLHSAGVQQTRHQHGSVFYVTGLSKQEMFNAAEKTKESIVDEVVDSRLSIKDLSMSPGSTQDSEPEVTHECPVDVSNHTLSPKLNGQANHQSKKYTPQQFPKLPNYTLTKDELGVTHISDISKQDMDKVRSLALIELTALFDSHGIALHRRKPIKRKVKESGIFGVPLQYMVQHDRLRGFHTKVPVFLQEVVNYLEKTGLKEEGILRVPGSVHRIKVIKEDIEETFNDGGFNWNCHRPHDVVSLLKQFLRELPFPLLTHEYQPTFASVENIPDRRQQLQALNLLILLLPSVHRDCLRILLLFLKQVILREKQNKMNLNNVAMIMAPNLFLFKSQNDVHEIKSARGAVNVVRMLIKYQNILWTIPGFMVMQVRYLYEAEGNKRIKDAKAVRKLLLKRSKEGTGGSPQKKHSITDATPVALLEADKAINIIRVKAPMLNKIAMAIQLTQGMTAGDIVDKFKRQPEGSSVQRHQQNSSQEYRNCVNPHTENKFAHDCHYLFEAGGNIGERRLDHETNVIALHKVNPHAEWIIKPLSTSNDD